MGGATAAGTGGGGSDVTGTETAGRSLVLDEMSEKLAAFRLLRSSDQAATDRLLDDLGAQGRVEHEMVVELAAAQPLAHPERFLDAHVLAMRALEVLNRNGARQPSQLRVGFLTPVARWTVQRVIRFIVRHHQAHVIDSLRDLYTRRHAWTAVGDPARALLFRARADADRSAPSYKKSTGGLPTFLLGGAVVSTVARAAQQGAGAAAGSRVGVVVAVLATFTLLAIASWVILHGAAVARRRIRVTMDTPLQALWETIGSCGNPPKDQAGTFALLGILLTAVGWAVIPLGVLIAVTLV